VNIAAICPIGYLDRHGYQYTWRECIASQAKFADKVYAVASTPHIDYDFGEGVRVIFSTSTFFEMRNGEPHFDAQKVMDNCNVGADQAKADGFDIAVVLFCNWYVPEYAIKAMRARCELMLAKGQRYMWLFRRDQLAGQMFSVSTRLPFIVNLHDENRYQFGIDSISDGKEMIPWQRGNMPSWDDCAVVDVQLEMPLEDLEAKMNFIRCYHDLVPKRDAVFDANYWLPYYAVKFKAKIQAGGPKSATGKLIAEKNQPEFVSNEILRML